MRGDGPAGAKRTAGAEVCVPGDWVLYIPTTQQDTPIISINDKQKAAALLGGDTVKVKQCKEVKLGTRRKGVAFFSWSRPLTQLTV